MERALPAPDPLDATLARALAALRDLGHPVRARVQVEFHAGLRATATTFRTDDGFGIWLSPERVSADRVDGLLAHELGHVALMDAEHPSHDDDAITAAYASLPPASLEHGFQRAFVHHAINIVEDLYADSLGFDLARRLGALTPEGLDALLESFVRDTPDAFDDPREARWDHAHDMINNARSIALLKREGRMEAARRAEAAQARFLARISPDIAAHAAGFQAFYDGLDPHPTREAFTATLVAYVGRFVAVADGS